jgi:enoyl-[acyl-carrier protein] reductase I
MRRKKGLIVGVANQHSIAWGCARVLRKHGADLAITYANQEAETYVRPLAQQVESSLILPLDVQDDVQLQEVFQTIRRQWGTLDFVIHSIAFAPKTDLHGRVVDCSKSGFITAMDISCYSFIQLARLAEPLMENGGTLLTITYYGGEQVIPHYNIMGPVKAALESSVKYMASELGSQKIRVNAISPGPIMTRAASGLLNFQSLLDFAKEHSPEHELTTIEDIGEVAAFLVSDRAKHITGTISFVDCGLHIMGA